MVYMCNNVNCGETTFKSIGHFVKANYNCINLGIFQISYNEQSLIQLMNSQFMFKPNCILIMLLINTPISLKQYNEVDEEWKCNLLEVKNVNESSIFFSCYLPGPPLGMDYEVYAIMEQVLFRIYWHNTRGSESIFPTAKDLLDPRPKLHTACQGNGRYSHCSVY